MNNTKLKYFTILGERCSGTHFVQYAIEWNLNLEYYPICGKHFFGHDNSVFDSEKMKETLVICVFRKPIDWLDSYFKRQHHVPPQNKNSLFNFLNNEFYSIHELPPNKGSDILEDYHITEKRHYHNIFELRKTKNDFMLNTIPSLVSNFMMLRYEDLRDDFDKTLDIIKETLSLETRNETYKRIVKYKGTYFVEYAKKPILINPRYYEYINSKIDREQEYRIENMDLFGKLIT